MGRVLLTGATGFIGTHALDALLRAGHEVHAVARRPGSRREGVVWRAADLLDPGEAERLISESQPTSLLHLAWYATPGSFWTSPENERWIDASLRLLRAFGEFGGSRAVMAGTCAEYRWDADVLREDDTPLEPSTLYGACKRATHVAASAIAAQLEISLAWARVFFLYGPGEPPGRLVSSVVKGLLAGEDVPTTDGHQRRDFMHVSDVAGAFAALVDSRMTGAVNVASGEPVAVRDILMLIEKGMDARDRVRFGALSSRPEEPDVIAGDSTRMRQELGFTPATALEPGLLETIAWWRARARGGPDAEGSPADPAGD